jgi:hypothetical protein
MRHDSPQLREVIRPGQERPQWITEAVWVSLSWRERDYIILERQGVSADEIRRKLYFPKIRAFQKFKRRLRQKMSKNP